MFEHQFSNFQIFLLSTLLGVIFNIAYEIISSTLGFLRKRIWVSYVQDILFFFTVGVLTFMFLLVVNFGEFRFFVFIGELLGGVLCYLTIGKLISFLFQTIKDKLVLLIYSIKHRILKKA